MRGVGPVRDVAGAPGDDLGVVADTRDGVEVARGDEPVDALRHATHRAVLKCVALGQFDETYLYL